MACVWHGSCQSIGLLQACTLLKDEHVSGMSAAERAELEAMHANERQLYDQLDRLDEELADSKDKASKAEAEKQLIFDEFQSLQAQVTVTHKLLT